MIRLFISIIICFFCWSMHAQMHYLKGSVMAADTKEPIPFASVFVKGTSEGTITDTVGVFAFRFSGDSVTVSAIGFETKTISVENVLSELNVQLLPAVTELEEVKVLPSDHRVRWILKNAIKNKSINNPERYDRYAYQKYTKWDYNLNNAEKSLMKSRAFRNHKHLFKQAEDSSFYLPVYFSEQVVYNEFQRKPLQEKSTVLADKTSGIGLLDNLEVGGYTSGLDININYYDNYLNFYEQNFVSPIADNGRFYYRYYLEDSVRVDGDKYFKVTFYPKRKGENVFRGYMLIDDERFAIQKIEADVSAGNQLNFIKNFKIKAAYQLLHDSIPFYKSSYTSAVFDYLPVRGDTTKDRLELTFQEFTSFSKVQINPVKEIELSDRSLKYEAVALNGAKERDSVYWANIRHQKLTRDDLDKYAVIDSLNELPSVKLANDVVEMGMTGYFDVGKFEVGPYTEFLESNKIEGTRFFFGGRTSSEISEHWMFYGGLGYGTKNNLLTGHGGIGYKIPTAKRNVLNLSYDDSYIRMGENRKILYLYENMLTPSETNLISTIFARDEFDELYRQQSVKFSFEHEWRTGLSTTLMTDYMKQYSPEYYPYVYQGNEIGSISAFEVGVNFRLSWKEKYIDKGYRRLYTGSDHPIVNVALSGGYVSFENKENGYAKVHATFKHKKYFGQTFLNYAFEVGKIFGTLPYTMLEIPRGNETYGYYRYDFNMINYLEFVHDQYFNSYIEYHLNGFFFNRMPLLKRLGLREVLSAKTMMGSLSEQQKNGVVMPNSIRSVQGVYAEVGAGLENVFRFFRIEGVWRLAPQSIQDAPSFGVRVKFEIKL
ncbi:DUF5686 and carboxypeptidase-like regulatory domain-containing protein [Saccharicrinis fermentans]|nr:DUF5686 family protein [Saccharicrinis fermentans]